MARLTAKQQRFVEEYCGNGWNATQAAISAGYSPHTAKEIGYENLTKPHIAVQVAVRRRELAEKAELSGQWVLDRLKIEALREDEGSTHSARVTALKLLGDNRGLFNEDNPPPPAVPTQINVNLTAEKPIGLEHSLLRPEDLEAASRFVGMAGAGVSPHGGKQPVDPKAPAVERPAPKAATNPPAG